MLDPYATGVLTPEKHGPLVQDLDKLCERAGIGGVNKKFVWSPVGDALSKSEVEYLRQFHFHTTADAPKYGLVYSSTKNMLYSASIQERMMVMVGCLMRNFVDARIMQLDTVLQYVLKEGLIEAKCLFVPNFFIAAEADGMLPYKKQAIHDMLLYRIANGLQTVLYVDKKEKLAAFYGEGVKGTLSPKTFIHVEV